MRLLPYTLTTRRRRRTQHHRRTLVLTAASAAIVLAGAALPALTRASAQTITLDIDGHTRPLTTTAATVRAALSAAHVQVSATTSTTPALTSPLEPGGTVQVRHERPVTFVLDGYQVTRATTAATVAELTSSLSTPAGQPKADTPASTILDDTSAPVHLTSPKVVTVADGSAPRTVHTYATTVAGALADAGVHLGGFDAVDAAEGEPLTSGLVLHVTRAAVTAQVEQVAVPAPSTTVPDPTLPVGTTQVRSSGVDGVVRRTWQVTSRGGVELERTVQGEQRTDPVAQVVAVGTKQPSTGDARAIGQQLAAARGWTGAQWTCVDQLFTAESSWRVDATNSSSGAYGIPQALPGAKMASAGSDWATNAATQITWGLGYIAGRYSSPCAAWSFHTANGWY